MTILDLTRLNIALTIALMVVGFATPLAFGTTADQIADHVLGPIDFAHTTPMDFLHPDPRSTDAKGLATPIAVAIDLSVTPNRLYISDVGNRRVLGYRNLNRLTNGAPADLVIGQANFGSREFETSASGLCKPQGVAVDPRGNLFVADADCARVLEYDRPFATCKSFPCMGIRADRVFGQDGNFTSHECHDRISAKTLCDPVGEATDAIGNLYVSDETDNRVLEYNQPLTTDTVADRVFGREGDFNSRSEWSQAPSAKYLNAPQGVAVDAAGNLYVADTGNQRVLEYD